MVKYSCETCQKTFSQKGHLETHKNRKRPCKKDNTIEALVEQKVKEALSKTNIDAVKNKVLIPQEIESKQIDYSKKSREELIAICKEMNATTYINAIGGVDLYDKDEFLENKIFLNFIKSNSLNYKQFDNEFIPWLSIIDVMMFNSKNRVIELVNSYSII